MLIFLFWFSLLFVVYTYFGYPVLLAIAAKFARSELPDGNSDLQLTLLITAYNEESVINFITNFHDISTGPAVNFQCTFNPLDKVVELFEEKEKLYERLLQAEKDKVAYLEKLLDK